MGSDNSGCLTISLLGARRAVRSDPSGQKSLLCRRSWAKPSLFRWCAHWRSVTTMSQYTTAPDSALMSLRSLAVQLCCTLRCRTRRISRTAHLLGTSFRPLDCFGVAQPFRGEHESRCDARAKDQFTDVGQVEPAQSFVPAMGQTIVFHVFGESPLVIGELLVNFAHLHARLLRDLACLFRGLGAGDDRQLGCFDQPSTDEGEMSSGGGA